MRKRPGTRFLDHALPVVVAGVSHPSYLVKFEFSLGQTYILEFGEHEMRFWIDDHLIIDPNTGQPYKIATPYTYIQAKEMTFAQYKDTLFCTHWDLPIQKLVRGRSDTHTNWYWELVVIEPDDLVRAPTGVHFIQDGHNGVSYAVTAIKDGQESRGGYGAVSAPMPSRGNPTDAPTLSDDKEQLFVNVKDWLARWSPHFSGERGFPEISADLQSRYDVEWVVEHEDLLDNGYVKLGNYINVYHELFPQIKTALVALGYTHVGANIHFIEKTEAGNWGGFGDIAYTFYHTVGRYMQYKMSFFWPLIKDGVNYAVPLVDYYVRSNESGGTLTSSIHTFGGSGLGSWDTRVPGYTLLGPTSPIDPTLTLQQFGDSREGYGVGIASSVLAKMIRAGTFGEVKGYTYEEVKEIYDACLEFIYDGTIRPNNIITWDAAEGATGYRIYRNTHADEVYKGFYLLDQVGATVLTYEDPNVNETTTELEYSPAESGLFFNSPDTYPHVCTFFQQRFVVGSTHSAPLQIGGSRPGFFEDFLLSPNPLDTTGAWRFELMSQTSNPIKHIVPIRGLQVFTEAGAFASAAQGSINASNVNFNQEAFNGVSAVKPVIVDRSVVYVPLNKQMLSVAAYDLSADTFVDDDLLFTAQALTSETEIVSIAYLRPTSSIVAAVLADGRLLTCTFIPRQEFMGWTENRTAGRFIQCCANTNAQGYDELYLVVERNGKYLIEKLEDTRPSHREPEGGRLYLDSGLSGTFSEPVSIVTGLEHLEGLEVGAVATSSEGTDGAGGGVQRKKIVHNGQFELDYPATHVHVGLPYEAELETLDLELQSIPTLRGAVRHIIRGVVEIEETSDISWSLNGGQEWDAPLQPTDSLADAPHTRTFDVPINGASDYVNGTRVKLRSRYPLPCQINSIVAEVQVG